MVLKCGGSEVGRMCGRHWAPGSVRAQAEGPKSRGRLGTQIEPSDRDVKDGRPQAPSDRPSRSRTAYQSLGTKRYFVSCLYSRYPTRSRSRTCSSFLIRTTSIGMMNAAGMSAQ